ncbi:MAG: glycosyl hydrolase family 18 protein [Ignavibacteria bacterium]|nr:glycosyl hydrolase family 18 protein [Ignavibacteria bacterium]
MKYSILLFLASFIAFAQNTTSVHAYHKQIFGSNLTFTPNQLSSNQKIIPLQVKPGKADRAAIFGYLPYWEYSADRQYLRYDILTHIAMFDFGVDAAGNVSSPSWWPWTDVINAAHSNGVKVIMCVTGFDSVQTHKLFINTTAKANFFANVKQMIQSYQMDGVNIDFEALNPSDRTTVINSFMADLTTYLKSFSTAYEISFAGPALTGTWNVAELANSLDYIFIMGYDFYGSWSSTTGASAPFPSIASVIQNNYANVIRNNPKKLILGVPYYGNRWKAKTTGPHAQVIQYEKHTFFRDDVTLSANYGTQWATDDQVPYYSFAADTGYHQTWFENDSSLSIKYALAQYRSLRGVGMWALGYDGSRNELWNKLYNMFVAGSNVQEHSGVLQSKNFTMSNYPNPFNATTILQYNVPVRSKVSLRLYDCTGREVAVLIDKEMDAGSYKYALTADQLSSGIYFVRAIAGSVTVCHKIALLK